MANKRRTVQAVLKGKQNALSGVPALLGSANSVVSVPDREGYVYVRFANGSIAEVANRRVPEQINLPVYVGYDPLEPNLLQVLSTRIMAGDTYANSPSLPKHGLTHRFFETDPVWVELRQFMPLRVGPAASGGMSVTVYRGVINTGGTWAEVPTSTIDLTASIPATSGYSRWVLVSIDRDGDIITTDGSDVVSTAITLSDMPAVPTGAVLVLAAVRLYNGQTYIAEAKTNTDILDLRFPYWHYQESQSIHRIVLYHAGVFHDFDAWSSGLDAASAAAVAGDFILIPPMVLTGNHTLTAGVNYVGSGARTTILSGLITAGAATVLDGISIHREANDANDLVGLIGPTSSRILLYDLEIGVQQDGAGNSYCIQAQIDGDVALRNCYLVAESAGGTAANFYAPIGYGGVLECVNTGFGNLIPIVGGTLTCNSCRFPTGADTSSLAYSLGDRSPLNHTHAEYLTGSGTEGRLAAWQAGGASLGDSALAVTATGAVATLTGTLTADRTYTLPDQAGTIPLLETSNTFTQGNEFPYLGIGVAPSAAYLVYISKGFSAAAGSTIRGVSATLFDQTGSTNSRIVQGLNGIVYSDVASGLSNNGSMAGGLLSAQHRGDGTVAVVYGAQITAGTRGLGGADTTGTINQLYGLALSGLKTPSSTITTTYALLISGWAGTNVYDIYANDASALNYFAGNTSIGKTFSNHGGYGNVLDLAGGITIQRASDTSYTYLMAGFTSSGTIATSVYMSPSSANNDLNIRTYTNDARIIFMTNDGSSYVNAGSIDDSGNWSIGALGLTGARMVISGAIAITDGMTAPAATSGYAKIYVDSADGDLKIRFGDGTIKTIVTDT